MLFIGNQDTFDEKHYYPEACGVCKKSALPNNNNSFVSTVLINVIASKTSHL